MSNKNENEDKISLLPECLIHHILSFLNTKHVVQTCVLSKRWKTVWTHVPTLNFDFNSYPFELKGSLSGKTSSRWREKSFKRFIWRFISQNCGGHIQKLSYTSSKSYKEEALAKSLISHARRHMVQELCIDTFDISFSNWKLWLVGCQSLTVLKISCAYVDDWGGLILPSLRTLEITCYTEDGFEEGTVFAGCPNLESLVLFNYHCKNSSICGPKLEYLELHASAAWLLTFQEVELFTPNLRCIKSPSFHNARSLTLPFKAIEFLLSAPSLFDGSILFHNLTHLKLETKETDETIDFPINLSADLQECLTPKKLVVDVNRD